MFEKFARKVHEHFVEMSKHELYYVELPDIYEQYLAAFPEGTNPMYRVKTEHDCSCCKHFIRNLGIVVAIKNGQVTSIWDVDADEPYKTVAAKLSQLVKSQPIKGVYRISEGGYGVAYNYDTKTNQRHDHFFAGIGIKHKSATPDKDAGVLNTRRHVLQRGLGQIRISDIDEVLSLIAENQLYRGNEHKHALENFRKLLVDSNGKGDLFAWEHLHNSAATFRNTVIGTLLVELAEGRDFDEAVKSFETKVAPMNYKRPTAVITQKMVENAVSTLHSLGLGGMIHRRFAKFTDVSVRDVLFVDNSVEMKDYITKLLNVKRQAAAMKQRGEITEDYFIKNVLPGAQKIQIELSNQHLGNFVSITGADGPERPFKWNNNFAWSYDGDVTDSVKERVKQAGGKIDCKLRVSLSWFNFDDLDLHAQTPSGEHIFYGNKRDALDVDMNAGSGTTRTPVENLAFDRLMNGQYRIWVHQYHRRETQDVGFNIEVESDGVLREFSYDKVVNGTVPCFTLVVADNKLTTVSVDNVTERSSSKEKWGVKTGTLIDVQSIMTSPNHWGDNRVGQQHLIFALKDCKNPNPARGIYNEFLRGDLEQHRKVFEVLGNKTKCPYSEEQISGVGFTGGRNDSVNVVVDGRPYTVRF